MNMRVIERPAPTVTLVGHCFASIGMSEHIREVHRSLRKVGVESSVYDVYGQHEPTPDQAKEFRGAVTKRLAPGVRIFHINGDEVDLAYRTIEAREQGSFSEGYNIIYPAWELPIYPAVWARELERFDEVWAPSEFIRQSISAAVNIPVVHMPLASEPRVARDLTRRYLGIPEDRYVLLFFWDALSYTARKNPDAVIEVFKRVVAERPLAPVHLVLKVNNFSKDPKAWLELKLAIQGFADRVSLIDRTMGDDEVKNLIRCCDCFISLHRSEGFGRGSAEAMYFGVPVIATGWSGNMDFMTAETSLPVGYTLVPVQEGQYPHPAGQHWAEPDLEQAKSHMLALLDNPERGRAIGQAAGIHMRRYFSHRARGVSYMTRLAEVDPSLV
jgi:glycosyltransferase involved in cell wall biosynthesis